MAEAWRECAQTAEAAVEEADVTCSQTEADGHMQRACVFALLAIAYAIGEHDDWGSHETR